MSKQAKHILIFASFLTAFSNFQHPVTPVYLESIGFDKSLYGFLFAFMALGLSVTAPFAGRLADRIGTKVPMFFGIISYAAAQVLFVTFTNIYMLIFLRFLAGVSMAFVFPLLLAYISKVTTPVNRARAMSFYAAIGIMFVSIGYKIGGFLEIYIDAKSVFYLQGIIMIFLAIWVLFIKNVHVELEIREKFSFKSVERDDLKIFFLYFITAGVFMTVTRFLDVLIIDLGYTANDTGNFVLVTGLVGLLTNFVILPVLSKKFPEYVLMRYTLLLSSVTLFITFKFFDNIWLGLYSVFLIYMMAKAMYAPVHNSYVSKIDENKQGEIIGISESARMFGMFVGPIVGGFIYKIDPRTLYISLAAVLMGAYLIGRTLNGSKKKRA